MCTKNIHIFKCATVAEPTVPTKFTVVLYGTQWDKINLFTKLLVV